MFKKLEPVVGTSRASVEAVARSSSGVRGSTGGTSDDNPKEFRNLGGFSGHQGP